MTQRTIEAFTNERTRVTVTTFCCCADRVYKRKLNDQNFYIRAVKMLKIAFDVVTDKINL
jgi:hypothetical protein